MTLLLMLYLENIEFRLQVPVYSEMVISRHIVCISGHTVKSSKTVLHDSTTKKANSLSVNIHLSNTRHNENAHAISTSNQHETNLIQT